MVTLQKKKIDFTLHGVSVAQALASLVTPNLPRPRDSVR